MPGKREFPFPLVASDYLRDTRHLKTIEHGGYWLALLYEWVHGPLPEDVEKVARIMGLGNRDTTRILEEFFLRKKGVGWVQKRVEEERERVAKLAAFYHERAVNAINTRWKGHVRKWPQKKNSSSIPVERSRAGGSGTRPAARAGFVKLFTSLEATTKAKAKPSKQHPRKNHSGARSAGANSRTVRTSQKPAGRAPATGEKKPSPPEKYPSPNLRGNRKAPDATAGRVDARMVAGRGRNSKLKTVKRFTKRAENFLDGVSEGVIRGVVTKRETKAKERGNGDRFAGFQQELFAYWNGQNPEGPKSGWEKRDSAVLRGLLESHPDLQLEDFKKCLRNRAHSQVNPAELPHTWLRDVLKFAAGPLDRYGKPLRVH